MTATIKAESVLNQCEHRDGCEAGAEPGEPYCAFHSDLSDRNDKPSVPLAEVGGKMRWDGYYQTRSKLALRPFSSREIRIGSRCFFQAPKEWQRKGWGAAFYFFRNGVAAKMLTRGGQLERLSRALLSGLSIRAAARAVGSGKGTARKLYRILASEGRAQKLDKVACPCGKPSNHRGWCSHRFQQSPARQRAMAELHHRQRMGA